MPLSIVTLVAFEDFQERVVDCPFSMADGDAVIEIVGEGAGGGAGGGVSTFVSAAGTGATFLAQPAPKNGNAKRIQVKVASVYNDRVIGSLSFFGAAVFKPAILCICAPGY